MIVRGALDDDVRHVVLNMRAANVREVFATREPCDLAVVAEEVVAFGRLAIFRYAMLDADRSPVAIVAAYAPAPGRAIMHMVATETWPQIGRPVWRFLKETAMPTLRLAGIRLAQADVLDSGNPADRAWLERLGFAAAGPPVRRGRHGEAFIRMAWVNPDPAPRFTWPAPA